MLQNNNKANLDTNQQSLNQEELLQTSEKFFGFMIFVAFTTGTTVWNFCEYSENGNCLTGIASVGWLSFYLFVCFSWGMLSEIIFLSGQLSKSWRKASHQIEMLCCFISNNEQCVLKTQTNKNNKKQTIDHLQNIPTRKFTPNTRQFISGYYLYYGP